MVTERKKYFIQCLEKWLRRESDINRFTGRDYSYFIFNQTDLKDDVVWRVVGKVKVVDQYGYRNYKFSFNRQKHNYSIAHARAIPLQSGKKVYSFTEYTTVQTDIDEVMVWEYVAMIDQYGLLSDAHIAEYVINNTKRLINNSKPQLHKNTPFKTVKDEQKAVSCLHKQMC